MLETKGVIQVTCAVPLKAGFAELALENRFAADIGNKTYRHEQRKYRLVQKKKIVFWPVGVLQGNLMPRNSGFGCTISRRSLLYDTASFTAAAQKRETASSNSSNPSAVGLRV